MRRPRLGRCNERIKHNFPDQAEGCRRFSLFDTNKDGVLSEEEFINMGRK
jgi:Ca2+-binding EF-hand superfamily protein